MAMRDILIIPDKRLRLKSEPVEGDRQAVRALVDDMFETMYEAPGIGLAAIQIGVPQRVVTMDLAKKDEPKAPQVFINPEVDLEIRRQGDLRGRLPVDPGILRGGRAAERGARSNISTSTASRRRSRPSGLLATCLQHEIDHINGVLFIDHISKLKRDMVLKKFKKAAKARRAAPATAPRTKTPAHHIG